MATPVRCSHPDGVTVSVGGVPVDPCVYENVYERRNTVVAAEGKIYRHVTKIYSRCIYCGHEEWSWIRQEDTEEDEDFWYRQKDTEEITDEG